MQNRRFAASILALSLAAGGLAPAASAEADTQMGTGASSEYTLEEIANAKRFLGLLVGVGALLLTVGVGIAHFAGPHLGLKLPTPR